jgi:peroxiredoxin family protein/TusA-related sulfurtransferase/rhodanese-related sulfurtransferase
VGIDGVDKRVDAIAMAITGGLTVEDLSLAQLCYSPPFGSARDVVNVVGLASRNIRDGLVIPAYGLSAPSTTPGKEVKVLDVRPFDVASIHPIPNSINISYKDIRKQAKSLDPSFEYRTVCSLGKTSYFASRDLVQAGHSSSALIGGLKLHDKPKPEPAEPETEAEVAASVSASAPTAAPVTVLLDCAGMACPGPLLKLKSTVATLPQNAILHVTATDPGFKADVKAFASSNGLKVSGMRTEKGVIHVDLAREGTVVGTAAHAAGGSIASAAAGVISANGADRKGATIVVFSQDYDKVLGALVIANGAAAMGGDVTMFFTFWGLNALRDPKRRASKPKTLMENMFGFMMPKGIDRLPISNMNFGGMGPIMLKHEMGGKNLPNPQGLMQSAKEQKIRLVACTMSMDAMGITAEELIDGVEYGGVAEYLGAAQKAGTNLFV